MLYLSTKAMLKNHNKGNMQQDIKATKNAH